MKIATITHDATGCRITLGDGTVHTYANIGYVAESLARAMLVNSEHQARLMRIREVLNRNKDGTVDAATITDLRGVLDGDVPF